ncbi:MAG: hypothetical protein RMJ28_05105 [Nitrososphaerota archaeon]|nr:hypothetical protein [Candidatus Calditenuaceae archaeon]MDW8073597.1 hypothetical protein [Nitrososphaerota archaeon]
MSQGVWTRKYEAAKCFKMHIDVVMGGDVDRWISATCTKVRGIESRHRVCFGALY